MERVARRRSIIDEVVEDSPMMVEDFLRRYGSPSHIAAINRSLMRLELSCGVLIETPKMRVSYEVERLGVRRGRLYAEVKLSSWEEAKDEAALMREVGRKAFVLTSSGKPTIRVYLDRGDFLTFHRFEDDSEPV